MKTVAVLKLIDFLKPLSVQGEVQRNIQNVVPLGPNITDDSLSWCSSKNASMLENIKQGTILVPADAKLPKNSNATFLSFANPRLAFQRALTEFFIEPLKPTLSSNAQIHPSAKIGANCRIGHFVVIEENCIIGDRTQVGHGTILHANTLIASDVKIGSNCTVGGSGFGYEKNAEGDYEFIPHIGNVVIEQNVEIGNNTCIDRAVLGSTTLKKNCKIDNLVHIAHGVTIGKNAMIIANAMIAGSAVIGENTWVAPSASVLNKIKIGKNVTVGMGAVVLRNVEENLVVVGNPAKPLAPKK